MNEEREQDQIELKKAFDDVIALSNELKAFCEEHEEYLLYFKQKYKGIDAKDIKFVEDPQKSWQIQTLIKVIEEQGMQDEVEGFDRMKTSGEIFFFFKDFGKRMAEAMARITKIKVRTTKRLLFGYEAWLANAKKAAIEKPSDKKLKAAIKKMEKAVQFLKDDIALNELKIAGHETPQN